MSFGGDLDAAYSRTEEIVNFAIHFTLLQLFIDIRYHTCKTGIYVYLILHRLSTGIIDAHVGNKCMELDKLSLMMHF